MERVCIVGGGATGASLLWALSQDPGICAEWEATLLHDGSQLGGHSLTVQVDYHGQTIPVDIGVQFISEMLYPNVAAMLGLPAFRSVGVTPFDSLKIACAFPPEPRTEAPQNWGNFPAYQQGPQFALYDADMAYDAAAFEAFIQVALLLGWGGRTLQEFFDDPPIPLRSQQQFVDYLVSPYMSIMNGYGSADLDQVTFGDLVPLFATISGWPTPLGAFTKPGTGWARFTDGSSTWVQAMADAARATMAADISLGATVTAVWTDMEATGHPVHVVWTDSAGVSREGTFDRVVLTTDMWTCGELLDNPENRKLWEDLYSKYVGRSHWPLLPGACYIHTDESILSPDLTEQLETLQFTAYYAATESYPYYDLSKTFTTYMLKNLLGNEAADGLYLTMYGDVREGTRMPDPSKVRFQQDWTHGMWAASFMGGPKKMLHMAQGLGVFSYPGQVDTNVYFAGNNTTTDSEEGALDSAMAIANYAFGARYPIEGVHPLAWAMFLVFYIEVMFPGASPGHRFAAIRSLHPR